MLTMSLWSFMTRDSVPDSSQIRTLVSTEEVTIFDPCRFNNVREGTYIPGNSGYSRLIVVVHPSFNQMRQFLDDLGLLQSRFDIIEAHKNIVSSKRR